MDTVIFGTGFHVTDMPMPSWIRGRDSQTLADVWSGGAQAHRGTTVAGFPNLFILVGPNTGLGHTSLIYMIESQVAYNQDVQRRMARTVWTTGGCTSWYLDAHGRNTTLWPTFTWRFRQGTRRFQPTEYVFHAHDTAPVAA